MSKINIPPEALEAAARAIEQTLLTARLQSAADNPYIPEARAAIEAALKAWPGMDTGPNIYGRQNAIMHLPMQKETSDE